MAGLSGVLFGTASKVNEKKLEAEFEHILVPGEEIEAAFQVIRDMFVFTDKRLVLVDKQGITGRKVEYHSIPYRSITHFAIETAGSFDADAELKIWVSGTSEPIEKEFKRNTDLSTIQRLMAEFILGL